jgi:hypothetical protein
MTEFKKGDVVTSTLDGTSFAIVHPAAYTVMHQDGRLIRSEANVLRIARPGEKTLFAADMLASIKKKRAELKELASLVGGDMDAEEWEESARFQRRGTNGKP